MKEVLLKEINEIFNDIVENRRFLHKNPEIGFNVNKTCKFVYETLLSYGIEPIKIGKNGLVCYLGNVEEDKCLLLRCDMDGLQIKEEASISFKSDENMHACGHDLHTAMLLAVAYILKKNESILKRKIKLLFQPAEEILEGAANMIENGVLNDVEEAIMIHVISMQKMETGDIIIPNSGIIAPSSDFFEIVVNGKSTHGAMPEKGVNPINICLNIIYSLNNLLCNEIGLNNQALLTFSSIKSGENYNVIPDVGTIKGSLRCFDELTREYLKKRMSMIVKEISKIHNGKGKVLYKSCCPNLINDSILRKKVLSVLKKNNMSVIEVLQKEKSSGSEDFSYISQKVPSLMISVVSKGEYPLHNQKVVFDEEVMKVGTLIYAILGFELI